MATIIAPSNVREEAVEIIKIFQRTPDLKMKVESEFYAAADLEALDLAVAGADKAVDTKRSELAPLLNARNQQAGQLNAVLVQARKVIAGYFGEDSDEYELAGGTRKSERKSTGRRLPAKPVTA
jgi:iron uptake system EfeUOB component EfeO/EfeM